MSLSTLVSAAQTAVELSDAAAAAAEDALAAANLARVHAKAALAAAELALELDKNINKAARNTNIGVGDEEHFEDVVKEEVEKVDGNKSGSVTGNTSSQKKKRNFCENCKLHQSACLHDKFLLYVNDRTTGMRVQASGSSWSTSKVGKIGQVVSGDKEKVKIIWDLQSMQNSSKNVAYCYNLVSNGEHAFKFWCQEIKEDNEKMENCDITNIEADKHILSKLKWCRNCKLKKFKCLNGKFLLQVREDSIGVRVKSCGSFWPKEMLSKSGIIVDGSSMKVTVKWLHSDVTETHYLITQNQHKFEFDCTPLDTAVTEESNGAVASPGHYMSPKLHKNPFFFAHRLPYRKIEAEVWNHDEAGEKHRIMFCASENISMTGLGFLVSKTIDRVIVNICQKNDHRDDHSVILKQDFYKLSSRSNGTAVLHLKHPLPLSRDRIYLVVVTMFGGASLVGHGGEEFVTVDCGEGGEVLFKFEEYFKGSQATNVEEGIIEKIYFEL